MGITWSGGDPSDMFDNIIRKVSDDAHEHFAQGVAAKARESGLSSADDIEINIENDSPDEVPIDVDRVRSRANEILAEG